jgi:uncharacterized membrane protein/predicted transcriptional regulator
MEKENKVEKENEVEKLDKSTIVFIVLIALPIVGSFVALVIAHILAINNGGYNEAFKYQETIFISALTLALMIVLIIPYMINKGQIKRTVEKQAKRSVEQEMKNRWQNYYQKKMDQFTSKYERDYAHISRMVAYLLKQTEHYYWAMAWAGDSVVAYIRRFKEHHGDFHLNKQYFNFSLYIMKKSFDMRIKGKFLENNIDLESADNPKDKSFFEKLFGHSELLKPDEKTMNEIKIKMDKINRKIYDGKKIDTEENKMEAVKELKRVILRYIKWQCIIEIEMQEQELSSEILNLIKIYLKPNFKEKFEDMVKKTRESFYVDESIDEKVDKEQFIDDIVKKVEIEEYKGRVREHLEKIIKTNTNSST